MAAPKVPAGWELEEPAKVPDGWVLEQPESATGVPGSPLEKVLAEQKGDVVTVQTPTGPTQFTRDGSPFYSPDEAAQMGQAG
ncbi:MAG TPA: hypothetical protein DCQ64_11285, partial [Candidatus Rokubacteria bacterium]|nr:hypothetical protein [Candidatus Rokubacteria bacterium]